MMKKVNLKRKKPIPVKAVDHLLGFVSWTERRAVAVYLRESRGRRYVRLRTFIRNQTKGHWYPSRRYFMVPIEVAKALGKAIVTASRGRSFGEEPDRWPEFERQYEEYLARKAEAEGTSDADRSDAPPS